MADSVHGIQVVPTVDRRDTIIARDKGWYCKSPDKDGEQELVYEYSPKGGFIAHLESLGFVVDVDGVVSIAPPEPEAP